MTAPCESLDDRVQKVLLYLPSMMKDPYFRVRLRDNLWPSRWETAPVSSAANPS